MVCVRSFHVWLLFPITVNMHRTDDRVHPHLLTESLVLFSSFPPDPQSYETNERQHLEALKTENQRLKDENGALIRVISKLSK